MPKLQIDFEIAGFSCAPDAITAALAITPDVSLMLGQRDTMNDLPRTSRWSRRSVTKTDDADLAAHWQTLSTQFVGKEDAICAIGGRTRLTVIIDRTDRVPPLLLPLDMIRFCGRYRRRY